MAKYYGYCYNYEGIFTEIIPLEEREITEDVPYKYVEDEPFVVPEQLCDKHKNDDSEDGTNKFDCPDCILEHTEYSKVEKVGKYTIIVGYEPIIPPNCTLEVCPDGIYYPVFKDSHWVKTVEPKPEEPSELEKPKKEMELMQKALDELIIAGM
ncbi:hypothetical protein IIM_01668 [Bacillus cereus VD107]|nr:hypothetical protein IIM_01668 [Bacillus cereus VD107]